MQSTAQLTVASASCHDCGTTRRELNRDRTGDLICVRCFDRRYLDETVPLDLPKPPRLRRPPDPPWVKFRAKVIDALVRDGTFIYLDQDRCGGLCPVCGDPLHVRFVGRQPEADLTCLRGCDERLVAAKLGRGKAR